MTSTLRSRVALEKNESRQGRNAASGTNPSLGVRSAYTDGALNSELYEPPTYFEHLQRWLGDLRREDRVTSSGSVYPLSAETWKDVLSTYGHPVWQTGNGGMRVSLGRRGDPLPVDALKRRLPELTMADLDRLKPTPFGSLGHRHGQDVDKNHVFIKGFNDMDRFTRELTAYTHFLNAYDAMPICLATCYGSMQLPPERDVDPASDPEWLITLVNQGYIALIVLEFIDGKPLKQATASRAVLANALDALCHVHCARVCQGDIARHQFLVCSGSERVVLVDFDRSLTKRCDMKMREQEMSDVSELLFFPSVRVPSLTQTVFADLRTSKEFDLDDDD